MTHAPISACPACNAAPMAQNLADTDHMAGHILLNVPTVHCAVCISSIEKTLNAFDGVKEARVNLTLRRATIDTTRPMDVQVFIQALDQIGYPAYELDASLLGQSAMEQTARPLLTRLAVSGFAMMNVMLLSIAVWSGAEGITRDMFHWISALIAVPATLYAAYPFFANAWGALRGRVLNMDVPISLAILLALGTSIYETSLSGEHAYFDAAISLTFFLLAGRYLDHRTRSIARSAAQELSALEVTKAVIRKDGQDITVPVSQVQVGDTIILRPGARMPLDGVVIHGQSEIDRSILTGETRPEFVTIGSELRAGEVNLTGPLELRATAVGQDTSLAKISQLVAIAESGRSKYTSIADKAAQLYAPGVHILSALSFVGWYLYSQDLRMSLNIAAAVLIITCPCALGLAVPAVTTAVSGRLFQKGLLIKSATAIERLAQVDTVVFDKTGTLTDGDLTLIDLPPATAEQMQISHALARSSAHPLAQALAAGLAAQGVVEIQLDQIQEHPGYGVSALYRGQQVRMGRAEWVGATPRDHTATWVQIGDDILEFGFADQTRGGAVDLITDLQQAGIDVQILSGDGLAPVSRVAAALGVAAYYANQTPETKAAHIAQLQAQGRHVLMIGDGLNDTAALTSAHVSISPATALDAARVASDIVFLGQRLDSLIGIIALSQTAQRRIRENFQLASLYNVLAVPVAIAGFATPLIAALAMSLSSITVTLNALRMK